jgi:DNA-binding MarR family transcriptional regulator
MKKNAMREIALDGTLARHDGHDLGTPAPGHASLRLWLRLLSCATLIEGEVRKRLRAEFATTLPRFDLMALLARYPEGLKMGELSHMMMVTGGNVTGIADNLERDGLVERTPLPGDRRAWKVRLTPQGHEAFAAMAAVHETWIIELMSGLSPNEQQDLYTLLGMLKQGVRDEH